MSINLSQIDNAINSLSNPIEGSPSAGSIAGGASIGTALSGALNVIKSGKTPVVETPLQTDVSAALSSLLAKTQQTQPAAISQSASGISSNLFSSASDLVSTLGNASTTLNSGLNSIDPSSLSSLESTAEAAEAKAQQTGSVADEMTAQQAYEKLQLAASTMSSIMSMYTDMDKNIISNFQAQG